MNILITGCAGFIGFHLTKNFLKKKNFHVHGVDNLNNYYSINYKNERLKYLKKKKNFTFSKIDISNFKNIKKVFDKTKFNLVINLAAQAGVRYSIENPKEYLDSNINGFFNILELCRLKKVKRIFYASSSSVYGDKRRFPLKEKEICNPKNVYSLSKKNNEDLAKVYSDFYNIKATGLRFFTIYGEWGRPDMFILKYILAIKNNHIFKLNNHGNHERDFTYIGDVIEIINILVYRNQKKKHEIYNICSNKPVKLFSIISQLNKVFGKPKIKKRKLQLADVLKTHGDNSKVKKITKFKNFTNIEIGLKKIILWTKENQNILKRIKS